VPRGVEQALVVVLSVKVDEELPKLPQSRNRNHLPPYPALRPPLREHFALNVEKIVFQRNPKLGALLQRDRLVGKIKHHVDRSTGGASPNQLGVGPLTQRQFERVDQQRLARPGLAGSKR